MCYDVHTSQPYKITGNLMKCRIICSVAEHWIPIQGKATSVRERKKKNIPKLYISKYWKRTYSSAQLCVRPTCNKTHLFSNFSYFSSEIKCVGSSWNFMSFSSFSPGITVEHRSADICEMYFRWTSGHGIAKGQELALSVLYFCSIDFQVAPSVIGWRQMAV